MPVVQFSYEAISGARSRTKTLLELADVYVNPLVLFQLFTAAPPLAMGLFDKVCSAETMLKYPALYKPSQNADLFNVRVFWVWILNSLGHSVLLYWLPLLAAENDVIWSNGREGGYLLLGNIVYSVRQHFDIRHSLWTCI
jgi:magnesium-transporting ATPase (P-type)